MTPRTQIAIRLDEEAIAALDAIVAKGPKGLNRSDYIRQAIFEYLEKS